MAIKVRGDRIYQDESDLILGEIFRDSLMGRYCFRPNSVSGLTRFELEEIVTLLAARELESD